MLSAARVQGAEVDLGAFEGEFDPAAPSVTEEDVEPGAIVFLLPENQADFMLSPAVIFTNQSDVAGNVTVTYFEGADGVGGGGYAAVPGKLVLQTTLPDGGFTAQTFIPVGGADLGGAAVASLDMTYHVTQDDLALLAVNGNQTQSPGAAGPVGSRFVVFSENGQWGITQTIGDHGVGWDPSEDRGFVWANLDHDGDLGAGIQACLADVAPPGGDGSVTVEDLTRQIVAWGAVHESGHGGVGDVNNDGVVDVPDLLELITLWWALPGCD